MPPLLKKTRPVGTKQVKMNLDLLNEESNPMETASILQVFVNLSPTDETQSEQPLRNRNMDDPAARVGTKRGPMVGPPASEHGAKRARREPDDLI
jgi:hypothetical protein